MASLAEVNATLQASNENQQAGHMLTAEAVERLHTTMKSFVKMMQIQQMKLLEAMREKQDAQVKEVKRLTNSQWQYLLDTAVDMANENESYERNLFVIAALKTLFLCFI